MFDIISTLEDTTSKEDTQMAPTGGWKDAEHH